VVYVSVVRKLRDDYRCWRSKCRWESSIKMGLREIGYRSKDQMNLIQDRSKWIFWLIRTVWYFALNIQC